MLVPKLRFKREDGTEYPEWEIIRLGELCTLTNGISKGKEHFGHGNRMVNLQDVFSSNWLTDNSEFDLVEVTPKELEEKRIIEGDVLFIRSSVKPTGVGLPCVVATEMKDTVFSGFIIRARFFQDRLNIGYKRYCFLEEDFRNAIMKKCSISANTNINQENLENIGVKTPCLEEQQKIADFLSTVDEVIAQSEAEVQNLEQQKKAAMQKIFSQEVRFKREDGTDYPDWEDCILSDYCEEIKSSIDPQKYPNDTFLEYSMPAFDMDKTPSTVIGSDMNSNRKIVSNPCVLINKLNVRKKRIWKVPNPTDNSVCSAEFIPVTSDKMSIDFLEYLSLTDCFTTRLLDCSTGTSNSQKRVTPDIIMDMPVSIPCLEEQQKIAGFLSAYDEAIRYAKQELDKWKELKKGLLQQMFV